MAEKREKVRAEVVEEPGESLAVAAPALPADWNPAMHQVLDTIAAIANSGFFYIYIYIYSLNLWKDYFG